MADGSEDDVDPTEDTAGSPTSVSGPENHEQRQPGTDSSTDTPSGKPWSEDTVTTAGTSSTATGANTEPGLSDPDLLEYTTVRRSLASQVQLQWAVSALVAVVVLSIVTTMLLGTVNVDPRFGAVALVVYFLLASVWIVLRYRRWVYQIRADALYLERGVLVHVRTLVPYVRIQHVDTSRGPLERALGLSTLVVYTAGSRGADVSIPGLTPEEARDLQQRVKELAIEAEGGDAL